MPDSASLDELERDVEQARARFAGDLARLRDPKTLTVAKDEFASQARSYKDQAADRGLGAAANLTQSLIEEARLRVERNPTAALVIGAGIAWRLIRHPPIATLLVGAGVASLLNTRPIRNGSSQTPTTDAVFAARDSALAARDSALARAHRASDALQRSTQQIGDQVRGGAATARVQASSVASDAADVASQVLDATIEAGAQISAAATRATRLARDQVQDKPLYFGAAAVLIGAALSLVVKSRNPEP